MRRLGFALFVLVAATWSCSDDTTPADDGGKEAGTDAGGDGAIGNDVAPEKFLGGGTGGGAIDGRLNVYVLESGTDKPLKDAFVMLDDGGTDQGTTDQDGLITFRRAGLKGPATLTCGLTGHATATVIGLDAANITINLSSRTPPQVDTGTCTGSVKDWDKLPPLVTNHFRIGYAGYLMDKDLGSAENSVAQPPGDLNLYSPDPPINRTSWSLTVPARDSLGVYILVLDVDTKGTTEDTDDERTLTHTGIVTGLKVSKGQTVDKIEIPLTPTSEKLKVTPPQKPAGTDEAFAAALVKLTGEDLLPVFFTAAANEFAVPPLSGDFAGGSYWVLMGAETTGAQEDGRQTESMLIKRDITDTTNPISGTLLDLPSAIKLEGRKLSFTAPAGTLLKSADLYPASSGEPYWSVTFVETTPTSFTLPTLPASAKVEQPPVGKLFLHVGLMEIPGVDVNNAKFKELGDKVTRMSQHGVEVELK